MGVSPAQSRGWAFQVGRDMSAWAPRLPWTGKGGGAAHMVGSDMEVSWGPAQAWFISGRGQTSVSGQVGASKDFG